VGMGLPTACVGAGVTAGGGVEVGPVKQLVRQLGGSVIAIKNIFVDRRSGAR
jgi:hypothetical protein